MGAAVKLTASHARRGFVHLELDAEGQEQTVAIEAVVARARCLSCGQRPRVLPCDMIAGKTYGLAVIEKTAAMYSTGRYSLRATVWSLLGDRTPSHTTLHAWSEGLGAYALGRESGELPEGVPFSALARETRDRIGEIEAPLRSEPRVDPRRYRSDGRRERLSSLRRVVAVAVTLCEEGAPVPPLVRWRQLAVTYGLVSPFSFRTGWKNPRTELVDAGDGDPDRRNVAAGGKPCEVHARSPPGDTSRSPPSSTQA